MLRVILGMLMGLVGFSALADPVLNSAILPNARMVELDATATIFITTLNSGDMDATNCQVVSSAEIGQRLDFTKLDIAWALTDAAGGLVGNPNDPFTIPPGGQAQLVLGIARTASAFSFDTRFEPIFHVECDGGFGSPGRPAVNGALIQFSDTDSDIIPIVQTFSADGIANFDDGSRLAVISVAAVNNSAAVGVEADVGVTGMYLGFRDGGQFNFMACETDTTTGVCLTALSTCAPNPAFDQPCFTTRLGRTPKTYAFFVILPPNEGAYFSPGVYRFAAAFRNQFGTLIASSSVALDSAIPVIANPQRPNGQYEILVRNTNDLGARTLRPGILTISDNLITGRIFRQIDQGAFIQIFEQFFQAREIPAASTPDKTGGNGANRPASISWVLDLSAYNSGVGGTVSDGLARNSAVMTITDDFRGGTFTIPDSGGVSFPGEPDVFDWYKPVQAYLIKNSIPFPDGVFDDAANMTVSSSNPAAFVQNFDINLVPGPDGKVEGSVFTLADGCVVKINAVNDIGLNLFAGMAIMNLTITTCPPDSDLVPGSGIPHDVNLEVQVLTDGSRQVKVTSTLGQEVAPNAAQLFDIVFKLAVPSSNDAPVSVAPSIRAKSPQQKFAQQIADEAGKPVYLHINGKDVLVAEPREK